MSIANPETHPQDDMTPSRLLGLLPGRRLTLHAGRDRDNELHREASRCNRLLLTSTVPEAIAEADLGWSVQHQALPTLSFPRLTAPRPRGRLQVGHQLRDGQQMPRAKSFEQL